MLQKKDGPYASARRPTIRDREEYMGNYRLMSCE